jgi:predicted DNA-binding WGR domain protein
VEWSVGGEADLAKRNPEDLKGPERLQTRLRSFVHIIYCINLSHHNHICTSFHPMILYKYNFYLFQNKNVLKYKQIKETMMRRHFIYKDEKSDKFWIIETKEDELLTFFGKNNDKEIFSGGKKTEKLFDTEEDCEKEAEKLILKKIKEGYLEQEALFLDICYGILNKDPAQQIKFKNALEELHKRDKPLKPLVGINLIDKNMHGKLYEHTYGNPDFENIKDFIRSLDKIEIDEISKNSFYCNGMQIAAITKDKSFEAFCEKNITKKDYNYYLGLAYLASSEGKGKEEIVKNMKLAKKNGMSWDTAQKYSCGPLLTQYYNEIMDNF